MLFVLSYAGDNYRKISFFLNINTNPNPNKKNF